MIYGKATGILLLGLSLFSCTPTNPLMSQSSIEDLRDYFVCDTFKQPSMSDCTYYFAKRQTLSEGLGNACNRLLIKEYDQLKKQHTELLKGASFEQFSDHKLWQRMVGASS